MRIIAGEHRGRSLVSPGDATRPITDRAKQSLFDVLTPYIAGAVVYDCFSGTGSMGLECLSRGAEQAVFFDADRAALSGLKKNIDALRVHDRAKVVAGDIFKLIRSIELPRADLIFLDPPYRYLIERPDPLRQLGTSLATERSTPDTLLLFRHDAKDALDLPGWKQANVKTYGSMMIEILKAEV